MENKYELVLASASPRRRELLENIGCSFRVVVSDAEENTDKSLEPYLYVQELALIKAAAVGKRLSANPGLLIIGADTVVYSGGKILGKPKDEKDAHDMLAELSGKTHEVMTGICVLRTADAKAVCERAVTKVTFRELSEETIRAYIATGEPFDKAGGYGIQGRGALLVSGIEGDYANVVGLPVSVLSHVLKNEFDYDILKMQERNV